MAEGRSVPPFSNAGSRSMNSRVLAMPSCASHTEDIAVARPASEPRSLPVAIQKVTSIPGLITPITARRDRRTTAMIRTATETDVDVALAAI